MEKITAYNDVEENKVVEADVCYMDATKAYLKSIYNLKLLTAEEEKDLFPKAKKGDITARDTIINGNLRLVVSIVKTYSRHTCLPLIDLIQEGNIGLMKAIDRFDVEKGFKFSTYATYWIKQSISQAIAKQGRAIRIPQHIIEMISKINRCISAYRQEKGVDPSFKEIAKITDIPEKRVRELMSDISKDVVSLDVTINEEDDVTIGDLVSDDTIANPLEQFEKEANRDMLMSVLDTLSEKEKDVIMLRFGLGGKRAMTLQEVGEEFGLTRERIRQIEEKALRKLRHPSRLKILKECV